jgi:hypothetical protein
MAMTSRVVDAARRLAHDVGKYSRLGAPDVRESDAGELRDRLSRDLRETRRAPDGTESVLDVYAAWRRDDGVALLAEPLLTERFDAVEQAIGAIARLLPHLDDLDEAGLRTLDEASLVLVHRCRELSRAARGLAVS